MKCWVGKSISALGDYGNTEASINEGNLCDWKTSIVSMCLGSGNVIQVLSVAVWYGYGVMVLW